MKSQMLMARGVWVAIVVATLVSGGVPHRDKSTNGEVLALPAQSVQASIQWTHAAPHEDTNSDKALEIPALNGPAHIQWTQVNADPYHISSFFDYRCLPPMPDELTKERQKNPHAATDILVYVNPAGREAMFSTTPKFPEGSIIVKKKFDSWSHEPVLYTIMTKRARGYNPKSGDWEFAVVSADGHKLEASGKLENCMSCHIPQTKSDYVFRTYLAPS